MMRALSFAAVLLASAPAAAQTLPTPPGADARLQTVQYDPNRVVRLRVPLGYQTTVILDPNEQIDTVAVGDSGAWQVTPNARGDHLFIKPLDLGQGTNLTVITVSRIYSFELHAASAPTAETPFTVRFLYLEASPPASSAGAAAAPAVNTYRLSGARRVRPMAIRDDGERTFIEWPAGDDLPAVFALDGQNREMLVTGYMREDRFVIDAVYPTLLFRLDRQVARATRLKTGDDE